jgi:large subunit ribosomal protein L43
VIDDQETSRNIQRSATRTTQVAIIQSTERGGSSLVSCLFLFSCYHPSAQTKMATRGVFQLTRLRLYYCEFGGSSATLRQYIGSGRLAAWATEHPHLEIDVQVRNGNHPFVEADYKTQAAFHQVSVKNSPDWKDIQEVLDLLRNRSGRKITKITTPVLTDTPSIQGVWTPFLNLQHEPSFGVKIENNPQS